MKIDLIEEEAEASFNPLDRGNLYQIVVIDTLSEEHNPGFQSPRSGKFVSDINQQEIQT